MTLSPFPGMDPYLESPKFWSNFHVQFLASLSFELNSLLPQNYLATVEKQIPVDILEEETVRWIQIIQFPHDELVSVVELLSPRNKVEPDRTTYLNHRQAWLRQPVHLVELDLLCKGKRLPMRGVLPRGDYYAFVTRANRRPNSEVYAWSVREPLPRIRIPLTDPDPDIVLDLQKVFREVYQRSGVSRKIRYGEPIGLPLTDENRAWVAQQYPV